jgi:hypothetical protein
MFLQRHTELWISLLFNTGLSVGRKPPCVSEGARISATRHDGRVFHHRMIFIRAYPCLFKTYNLYHGLVDIEWNNIFPDLHPTVTPETPRVKYNVTVK